MRKKIILSALLLSAASLPLMAKGYVADADVLKVNNRPAESERLFRSYAVEEKIKEVVL